MKKKLNVKLVLKSESMRLLTTRLDRLAGGQKPESRNWECYSDGCTHDLFCPGATGMCP